jgi:hypothetical protein
MYMELEMTWKISNDVLFRKHNKEVFWLQKYGPSYIKVIYNTRGAII